MRDAIWVEVPGSPLCWGSAEVWGRLEERLSGRAWGLTGGAFSEGGWSRVVVVCVNEAILTIGVLVSGTKALGSLHVRLGGGVRERGDEDENASWKTRKEKKHEEIRVCCNAWKKTEVSSLRGRKEKGGGRGRGGEDIHKRGGVGRERS